MPADESWLRRWWRPLLSELTATALLVFLGCLTLSLRPGEPDVHLLRAALGFGGVIAGLVAAFGEVSGAHMNPAVTLAALLLRRLPASAAAAYCLAQCAGAALASGALLLAAPGLRACTEPAAETGALAAGAAEAAMTGLLVLLCCAAWRPGAAHDSSLPVKFGLLVAGLVLAGGPLSGASLNPARSLGPALVWGCWRAHHVYWAGPLLGSAAAALLYGRVLCPPPPPARELEELAKLDA